MVFFKVIGFLIIAQAVPVALMWGSGAFVGQRQPSVVVANIIKFLISASLFVLHAIGALYAYRHFQSEWWNVPLSAIISGVGIAAIVALNSYNGEKD